MSKNSCHSKYVTDDSPIAEHEGDATHVVFLPGTRVNKVRLDVPAPELPALLLSTAEEPAKPRLFRPAQTPAASAGRLDSSATNFSDSASGAGGAALPDGEDGSMKLQEGSRVLDIERAVNGGMATGVLLCVRETDPKQVD